MSVKSKAKKVGSALWLVLNGPKSIGSVEVKKTTDLAKEQLGRGSELIKQRAEFWKQEAARVKGHEKIIDEDFEGSMERFNLDEAGLKEIYKSLLYKCRIEFFLMYAAFLSTLSALILGGITGFISGLFFSLFLLVVKARTSFRLYQVEKRKLVTLRWFMLNEGGTRIFGYV